MSNNLTDITLLIDASPSMIYQKQETIDGVNAFVHAQMKAAMEARTSVSFNLITFSTGAKSVESTTLNPTNYTPEYGCGTALYDAVGHAINSTGARYRKLKAAERPAKVLFVIVTDGDDNTSLEFTAGKVRSMIKHQTEKYQWDFVFMGANQDAWKSGATMGFAHAKTMTVAATVIGTRSAWNTASSYANRSVAAPAGSAFLSNAFSDAETKANVDLVNASV